MRRASLRSSEAESTLDLAGSASHPARHRFPSIHLEIWPPGCGSLDADTIWTLLRLLLFYPICAKHAPSDPLRVRGLDLEHPTSLHLPFDQTTHDMASNTPAVGTGGSPPQSVESITKTAQDYEYNESVPLRYWLRTAATLLREVSMTDFLRVGVEKLTPPALLGTNLRTRRT